MNATQGTILIMIGALALWLTWSAKSPFGDSKQKQLDDAFKQGQADAADIIAKKSAETWATNKGSPDSQDRNKDTGRENADLTKIKTPLICAALGGTWDYSTNECVRKH